MGWMKSNVFPIAYASLQWISICLMKAFLIDFSVNMDFLTESSTVDYQNSFSIVIRIPR